MAALRSAVNELGSVFLVACTVGDSLDTLSNAFERAHHVNVVFGISRGAALVALGLMLAAQVAAQTVLIFARFFAKFGSIVPSATLALLVWVQSFALGEVSDAVATLRCTAVTIGAVMLALFRYDQNMRTQHDQFPVDQTVFEIQAKIKTLCCSLRIGGLFLPASVALFGYAFCSHSFWSVSAASREHHLSRFRTCMTLSATALVISAQDATTLELIRDRVALVIFNFQSDGLQRRHLKAFISRRNSARELGAKRKIF